MVFAIVTDHYGVGILVHIFKVWLIQQSCMAGLDHSKPLFVGTGYGSFIHNANWDLKGAKGKKFREKVWRVRSFTKRICNFSADAAFFEADAPF